MSRCPKCGEDVGEDARYCPNCGSELRIDMEGIKIKLDDLKHTPFFTLLLRMMR